MIDSHVHIWDARRFPMGWLSRYPALADRYGLDDLLAEAGAAAPDRLVLVQAGTTLPGLRWLLREAQQHDRVAAVVASPPSRDVRVVERWLDQARTAAGGGLVRGVRVSGRHEAAGFFQRPGVRRLVAAIRAHGLVPCLLTEPDQLTGVAGLAGAGGELLVVDHLGTPPLGAGSTPRMWSAWRSGISALAAADGVVVKFSGAGLVAPENAGRAEAVAEHAVRTLGPDRLLLGSDWPGTTPFLPYPAVVARIEELLRQVGAEPPAGRTWWSTASDTTVNRTSEGSTR